MKEEKILKILQDSNDLPEPEPIATEEEKAIITDDLLTRFREYFITDINIGSCSEESLTFFLINSTAQEKLLANLKGRFDISRIEICDIDFFLSFDEFERIGVKLTINVYARG